MALPLLMAGAEPRHRAAAGGNHLPPYHMCVQQGPLVPAPRLPASGTATHTRSVTTLCPQCCFLAEEVGFKGLAGRWKEVKLPCPATCRLARAVEAAWRGVMCQVPSRIRCLPCSDRLTATTPQGDPAPSSSSSPGTHLPREPHQPTGSTEWPLAGVLGRQQQQPCGGLWVRDRPRLLGELPGDCHIL